MYCHVNQKIELQDVNVTECINMKVVSKDIKKVDFKKLIDTMNATCTKDYNQLPKCLGANYYYSEWPLYMLCDNCTTENMAGKMCMAYYVNYFKIKKSDIEMYMSKFMYASTTTDAETVSMMKQCNELNQANFTSVN